MTPISAINPGRWVGEIFGSHYELVCADISRTEADTIFDISMGSEKIRIFKGHIKNDLIIQKSIIKITLDEFKGSTKTNFQVFLRFANISDDWLSIEWESNNYSKGILQLSKPNPSLKKSYPLEKKIRVTKNYHFDCLRLYKDDLDCIINNIKEYQGFDGFIWLIETIDNIEQTIPLEEYLAREKIPEEISALHISANRNINGYNNSLSLSLSKHDPSILQVQSTDPFWANTPLGIKDLLEKKSNKALNFYKKHGLGLNFLAFLFLIVLLPEYTFWDRVIGAITFLAFAVPHFLIHRKMSLSYIYSNKARPLNWREKYPNIMYLSLKVLTALFAGLVNIGLEKLLG